MSHTQENSSIKLTAFSHGAGCGCKISPSVLSEILSGNEYAPDLKGLLVGNHSRDDAAVLDIGNNQALISTTDFFMPVVDDPFHFGQIAATNAISDVYAMGGRPVLAIAILGWPVNYVHAAIASKVISGARKACLEAGIPLAGGHSIDAPEPIFGLAVNGLVNPTFLKKNNTSREGDLLFLTKKIGIGVLTTASKKGLLLDEDLNIAVNSMVTLNRAGEELGFIDGVHALTDVTGFGLAGHLIEMVDGSNLSAEIYFDKIPVLNSVSYYLEKNCIPGGTHRNWQSYGHNISEVSENIRLLLADPQTSGGLLISCAPDSVEKLTEILKKFGTDESCMQSIGKITKRKEKALFVV